jgi:hypothetical protein
MLQFDQQKIVSRCVCVSKRQKGWGVPPRSKPKDLTYVRALALGLSNPSHDDDDVGLAHTHATLANQIKLNPFKGTRNTKTQPNASKPKFRP